MSTLYRIRSVWTGFSGAPGYTNHYFGTTDPLAAGAALAASDVRTFWDTIKARFPSNVTITVDPLVALIEDINGEQSDEINVTPSPAAVTGTGLSTYAAPVGASIAWSTSTYRFGRRVKGRSYIVPMSVNDFDAAGTLTSTAHSNLQAGAAGLVAGGSQMVVFSRPTEVHPIGGSSLVTGSTVPDRAAVLKSRRD
jgi:hypothetical protein